MPAQQYPRLYSGNLQCKWQYTVLEPRKKMPALQYPRPGIAHRALPSCVLPMFMPGPGRASRVARRCSGFRRHFAFVLAAIRVGVTVNPPPLPLTRH